jgi:outer membrane biosynthesis protein TonB
MISLEQVRLLEAKVARVIDYVKKVTEENSRLKEKLDSCQKRVDELEVLVQAFRDDQNRIEDGILAALNQLNQVEDAIGNAPAPGPETAPPPKETTIPKETPALKEAPAPKETTVPPARKKPESAKPEPTEPVPGPEEEKKEAGDSGQDGGELDIF